MRKHFPVRRDGGGNQIIVEIRFSDPAPRPHLSPRALSPTPAAKLHSLD
jgi:hypothetical protein